MRPRGCRATLTLFLFVLAIVGNIRGAQAQTYVIELQGLTWDHPTLTVFITPSTNQPWWRDYFLNATLEAVNHWNAALFNFSGYDPQFSFLSQVRLVPTIGSQASNGYDIYVSWLEVVGGTETVGTSQAVYRQPCMMISNTIHLAARIPQGAYLGRTDVRNAAVHELGHALGLSHTQLSEDVMSPRLVIGGPITPVSTLDTYAVWSIVKWMDAPILQRRLTCPGDSVRLPSTVDYGYLTPSGVLPIVNKPWTPLVEILEAYIAPIVLVVGIAIVVRTVVRWSRRPRPEGGIPEGFAGL